MQKERIIHGIILKKQDYSETDQIITVFSKEEGKIRAMVKAVKLPTSKLQGSLQPMFLSEITLARSSGMGKIIRASVQDSAKGVYADNQKLNVWFIVAEMLIKALPDEQPNEILFEVTIRFLAFLGGHNLNTEQLEALALQFQLKALQALGLGMNFPETDFIHSNQTIYFDPSMGGFVASTKNINLVAANREVVSALNDLNEQNFGVYDFNIGILTEARKILNLFVTYQLDRELKSAQPNYFS